jgi:DMSO/TMAO reductase YedYZ heme-binding membrane subunit
MHATSRESWRDLMQRHWRALVGMVVLMIVGFVGAIAFGSIAIALGSLISGLVVMFVMAIAYLRPEGSAPEHHPRIDHILDDTNP